MTFWDFMRFRAIEGLVGIALAVLALVVWAAIAWWGRRAR